MISASLNNNYAGSNNFFKASAFKNLCEMDAEQSNHQHEYVLQTELSIDDAKQTKLKIKHRRNKFVCPDC